MNNRMRSAGIVLAIALLGFAGCSSAPPWQSGWGQASSSYRFFGRKRTATPDFSVAPGGVPATDPLTSATESVHKTLKAAGDKVASAFELKPKVIPANDPSNLSSRPEQLTPALYIQAARLSENQGAIVQATRQYEKALELDPNNVNTLVAMARFCDRQGRPDEALRRYQQARGLAPENTIVLNDLGLFHARHGNPEAALEALDQAVHLDSRNVRYRNNLAAALVESRRVSEAVDVLRGVHPEATALFNAACLLALKDQTQPAAALLEQSLRIDPAQGAAREMLQALRAELLAAQSGMSPQGWPAVSPDIPLATRLETASRRSTVWESTPADEQGYEPIESASLPRKLPAAE